MTRIVHLSAGELTLDVDPELGASVAGFQYGGVALMRPMQTPAGGREHALHSGMFPMLPFANSLRDNRFEMDGRDYVVSPNMPGAQLNYHGSGWQRPWRVTEQAPDRCTLVLGDTEETAGYWFSGEQHFALTPTGLDVQIAVTNRSAQRMPFGLGLHPWFPRHGDARVTFRAGKALLEDVDHQALRLAPIATEQDFSEGREPPRGYQNRCYAGWTGVARIDWQGLGLGLTIEADPVFEHLMFHVPAHDTETFCLEPQSNRTSAFDGVGAGTPGPGVHILAPGETLAGRVAFVVRPQRA